MVAKRGCGNALLVGLKPPRVAIPPPQPSVTVNAAANAHKMMRRQAKSAHPAVDANVLRKLLMMPKPRHRNHRAAVPAVQQKRPQAVRPKRPPKVLASAVNNQRTKDVAHQARAAAAGVVAVAHKASNARQLIPNKDNSRVISKHSKSSSLSSMNNRGLPNKLSKANKLSQANRLNKSNSGLANRLSKQLNKGVINGPSSKERSSSLDSKAINRLQKLPSAPRMGSVVKDVTVQSTRTGNRPRLNRPINSVLSSKRLNSHVLNSNGLNSNGLNSSEPSKAVVQPVVMAANSPQRKKSLNL